MGRPRADEQAIATPERVLEAAQEEFAAVGYRSAKLADIAARAGIRRPSLLYHFKSKEELYQRTVERAFSRLGEALAASMRVSGNFVDQLLAVVRSYAAYLESEPAVARIILREMLDTHGPGAEIVVRQISPLVDVVERFIAVRGAESLPAGLPVRPAIMSLASDVLLRSSAGPLRKPLWGEQAQYEILARRLFLQEES